MFLAGLLTATGTGYRATSDYDSWREGEPGPRWAREKERSAEGRSTRRRARSPAPHRHDRDKGPLALRITERGLAAHIYENHQEALDWLSNTNNQADQKK